MNVITGETGAGKTILAGALSLLLGGRAETRLIRPGQAEAEVEAVFAVPAETFCDIADQIDLPPDEDVIIRRRISRDGRSRAFLNGRAVGAGVAGQVASRLMQFSAQHDQRRLMMSSRQMEILDRFAGSRLSSLREEFSLLYSRRSELQSLIAETGTASEAERREAELLGFQVAEIEAAGLQPGEEETLQTEQRRLAAAARLSGLGAELAHLLGGTGDEAGSMDGIFSLHARIGDETGADAELDAIRERLGSALYELEDIGQAAGTYSEAIQSDPARLQEIEERLDLLAALKRKYGNSIAAVIEYGAAASGKLLAFDNRDVSLPRMQAELLETEERMQKHAARMTTLREQAAKGLSAATARHLADLAFASSGFEVRVSPLSGQGGPPGARFSRTGADLVEFFITLNQGMPAAPLSETASGGELSRIMLAIKCAALEVGAAPGSSRQRSATPKDQETDMYSKDMGDAATTLVFDEIDAGIGGETGLAVGAKLSSLAARFQVICITHLPQIACWADAHFSVVKESEGGVTNTRVRSVAGDMRVDEICRMMGSGTADAQAVAHARSLLERVGRTRRETGGEIPVR